MALQKDLLLSANTPVLLKSYFVLLQNSPATAYLSGLLSANLSRIFHHFYHFGAELDPRSDYFSVKDKNQTLSSFKSPFKPLFRVLYQNLQTSYLFSWKLIRPMPSRQMEPFCLHVA